MKLIELIAQILVISPCIIAVVWIIVDPRFWT